MAIGLSGVQKLWERKNEMQCKICAKHYSAALLELHFKLRGGAHIWLRPIVHLKKLSKLFASTNKSENLNLK